MSNSHLSVLQEYYNETNSFYLAYKKEQDRILYFAGTVFICVISLTGIFGVIKQENLIYNYRWYHLFIFHTIFFILYLFYMYKALCAEVYLRTGMEIENAIQKVLKLSNHQTIHISQIKNKVLGDSLRVKAIKKGLNPGKVANLLILVLYFFTSLGPYIILQFSLNKINKTTFTIDSNIWTLVITGAFFIVFGMVDRRLYKRRKDIRKSVGIETRGKLENFIKTKIDIDE